MTIPNQLGELTLVDVRKQWQNEPSEFTPWLAKDENIAQLGIALGLELEVVGTEQPVGPFSIDILARDTATEGYVVIENQLGKTNHDHLGKTLTYAAGRNATAVVWIAAELTEEHRKALDWLNDNSSGDKAFFGVRLELWQIDQSRPAVRFNVVSRPIDIGQGLTSGKTNGPLSDAKQMQLEWWSEFRTALLEKAELNSVPQAGPRYWYNLPLGRTGIRISCTANTFDNILGVRVYLRSKCNAQAGFAQLFDQKEAIEAEIGSELVWDATPDASDKVISISRAADLRHKNDLPEYLEWMIDMTSRIRATFSPRVKELDLEVDETEE